MTGNQINSFVGNLVEMAKAYEELPGVRQEMADTKDDLNRAIDTIKAREESILKLKAELEEAHAFRQRVEAERDEALQSFLDADDRAKRILDFVKTTFGNAGALIQAVEPPTVKAEPMQTEKPQEDIQPVYDDPMAESPLHPAPEVKAEAYSPPPPAWATSEVDHTGDYIPAAPEVAPTPSPTSAPPAPTGTGTESVASATESPWTPDAGHGANLPYAGKRYHDVPGFIRLSDWLSGGGTEADYYWRP